MQIGLFRTGSSSVGFSLKDSLKTLQQPCELRVIPFWQQFRAPAQLSRQTSVVAFAWSFFWFRDCLSLAFCSESSLTCDQLAEPNRRCPFQFRFHGSRRKPALDIRKSICKFGLPTTAACIMKLAFAP
jgi:hypothetical protein